MKYRIRKTKRKMMEWRAYPLNFEWDGRVGEAEALEDTYETLEEAKAEVIQMRKDGEKRNLAIVEMESGKILSRYPDRYKWWK